MTYKEIRAGEELIAEFMGLYRSDGEDFGGQTKEMWFSKKTGQRMIDGSPKYSTDWNSLMSVWMKFRDLNIDIKEYSDWLSSLSWYMYSANEPKQFFERLVYAIKWYNEQKK